MDIVQIAEKIISLAEELSKAKNLVKDRAERKAKAKADYDKVLAITIVKLRNGEITDIEGTVVESVAITVVESIAKGICWKERLEMELSEGLYKSAISYIEVTTTQLQGYQSIYKHLDNA